MNETFISQQNSVVRTWIDDDDMYAAHLIDSAATAWERYRDLARQLNRNEFAMEVLRSMYAKAVEATEALLTGMGGARGRTRSHQ